MSDHFTDQHLQTLLREDLRAHADHLGVPAVPTAAVLGRGRQLRRRRRTVGAVGSVAATLVLGGSLLLSLPSGRHDSAPDPASTPGTAAVFAVGSHVYVGGTSIDVPGTVHSLHYTSEGVLVRSNDRGGVSADSGPETLTLVGGDGRSVDLGEVPEGWGPATDPDLPYYALAEQRGDRTYAVVRDVATGEVAASVLLPDLEPDAGDVPSLSLAGDVLYVDFADEPYAVDWRTSSEVAGVVDAGTVRGGLVTSGEGDRRFVRTAIGGSTFLTVRLPEGAYGWLDLSPDGTHAMEFLEELADSSDVTETRVYDVATGASVTVAGAPWELGWTRDGHLYRVDGNVVTTCSATTGACVEQTVEIARVPEPAAVDRTETICDKRGKNCGTTTWTEAPDEPDNKVTLAGRSYES